jgi:transcriptional regulator GlxA family with amidase domain
MSHAVIFFVIFKKTQNRVSVELRGILGQISSQINKQNPQSPELLRRLLRAKGRMDAASHEDWSIERLASVSHVSEAHSARSFKEAFGTPPHRYLLIRRIERTVALLRDSELSITEIAFQTGWRSLGTFGRIFREITGENPSTVRTQARAAAQRLSNLPACIVSATHRPDLKTSVLEKRRVSGDGIKKASTKGDPK